ncbi:DUF2795 domain-containing protein [Myxococcota bacterium]|nr:DUF2795 domain-containing protein [Myxococcota bacterium]
MPRSTPQGEHRPPQDRGKRGLGGASPSNILAHLKGLDFPSTRDDLVEQARKNKASPGVISQLERLDQEEFGGPQDVLKAYGRIH